MNDIDNYKRTKASDVYSVGVLMWEITSGRLPFHGIPVSDFLIKIIRGDREKTISGTPKSYNNIYRGRYIIIIYKKKILLKSTNYSLIHLSIISMLGSCS